LRKIRQRLSVWLALALALNLLFPASFARQGEASADAGADPYWTKTESVMNPYGGGFANGQVFNPSVTPDGRYVVFASTARNLVPDDAIAGGGVTDSHIYSFDRLTGQTILIDKNADGLIANSYSERPTISDDGSRIVFQSQATNLVAETFDLIDDPDSDDNFRRVYVYDRTSGSLQLVSVNSEGTPANKYSESAQISGDGNYVVFESQANNLDADAQPYRTQVYLRDLAAGTTTRLSPAEDNAYEPSISYDGSVVAFGVSHWNDEGKFESDIYRYAAQEPGLTKLTTRIGEYLGSGEYKEHNRPVVSADGSRIVFSSQAADLVPNDTNGKEDIFLYENGTLKRISMSDQGAEANAGSFTPDLSPDGRYVGFMSEATNLRAGIQYNSINARQTIFVYDTASKTLANLGGVGSALFGLNPSLADRTFVYDTYNFAFAAMNDADVPSWTSPRLTVAPGAGGSVSLSWDGIPGTQVQGYKVYETSIGTESYSYAKERLIGFTTETTFASVLPANTNSLSYRVEAVNEHFHTSQNGPVAGLTSGQDTEAPTWPNDASITVSAKTSESLTLSWPAGDDLFGVASYKVYMDNAATLEADFAIAAETPFTQISIESLAPDTDYTFYVVALDEAGNTSAPLPSITAATLPPSGSSANGKLTAVPNADGTIGLTWTAGTGVTRYEVREVTDAEHPSTLAEVSGASVSYVLQGLPASSTYQLRVYGWSGEQSVYETDTVQVSTGGIGIASVEMTRQQIAGGLSVMGAAETITVKGQPGRLPDAEVTYTTWYDTDGSTVLVAPRETTAAIALTENPASAGVYTGSFTFVEGIEKLVQVQAVLKDQKGTSSPPAFLSGAQLPIQNAAALRLTLTAPVGSHVQNYQAQVFSRSNMATQTKIIGDEATLVFDRVKAAPDTIVRVRNLAGKVVAESHAAGLRSGLVKEMTVSLQVPRMLRLQVTDGQTGVPNLEVSLDDGNGNYFMRTTDGNGSILPIEWDPGTTQVTARFFGGVLSDYVNPGAVAIVLPLAESEVVKTVALTPRQYGTIRGKVTKPDGTPAYGVRVSASQLDYGEDFLTDAYTDNEGLYTLNVFEGPTEVVFSLPQYAHLSGGAPSSVTVAANQEIVLDKVLASNSKHMLKINLYTRYEGGDWQGPLPIDWTTGIHLRVMVNSTYVTSPNVSLWMKAGEQLTVSADGVEGGLGKASKVVTLEADGTTEVELRLDQEDSLITASLAPPAEWAGQSMAYNWFAILSKRVNSAWLGMAYKSGYGSRLEIKAPEPGDYKLDLTIPGLGQVEKLINIDRISTYALGTIPITAASGAFSGRTGNSLSVQPVELVPGQTARVKVAYDRRHGHGSGVEAAFVSVTLPEGTSYVPQSATLNGTVATPDRQDERLIFPVNFSTDGDAGSIVFQLLVGSEAAASLPVLAQISYDDNGNQKTESLGTVVLTNEPVTLTAPEHTRSLNWELGGRAVPGKKVSVYASGQKIGESVATPGGLWSLSLTMPDPLGAQLFRVYAEMNNNGQTMRTPDVRVNYDPDVPAISRFTIEQQDGRRTSLDLSKGPARFPFVVVPGSPFLYEIQFTDNDAVRNVQVHLMMENGSVQSAEAKLINGVYHATGPSLMGMTESIYVTYDRKPAALKTFNRAEDLKRELPPAMRDYKIADVTDGFRPIDANTMQGSVDFTLPQVEDLQMHVDMSLQRNTGYTPTAEDLKRAEELGIEAYGVKYSFQQDEEQLSVVIEAYIPESKLGNVSQTFGRIAAAVEAKPDRGPQVRVMGPLDTARSLVKVTATVLWDEKDLANQIGKGAAAIYDAKSAVDGREQVAETMDKFGNMADKIAQCNPEVAGYYGQKIEQAATYALTVEVAKWGIMIAGAVLAPATFGGSLALMGASMAIGAALDYTVNHDMDLLQDQIDKSSSGNCPDDDPITGIDLGSPAANPVWIYDPSGYVYETFPDNRISDVKATVFFKEGAPGGYVPWDADWYGQRNPQMTDATGRFGWDVPPGRWQVVYEKDGYQTERSAELDVPPPHFDVNIRMVSYAAPQVAKVRAEVSAAGGTTIEFTMDKYVAVSALADDGITVLSGGMPLDGTLEAVGAREDEDGTMLTRTFRFRSAQAVAAGSSLDVTLRGAIVVSYAGTDMASDYANANVVVAVKDETAPALASAVAATSGNVIRLAFDEPIDGAMPLTTGDFTLTGTPLSVVSVGYGADGRTVELYLSGKLRQADRVSVVVPGGKIADLSGNAYAGGTQAVTNQTASSDAALSGLILAGYELSPSFSPGVAEYRITVPSGVSMLDVTATARDAGASIRMNGYAVGSGVRTSVPIIDELVLATVTAKDGRTKQYYELQIVRGSAGGGTTGSAPQTGGPAGGENVSDTGTLTIPAGGSGKVRLGEEIEVVVPKGARKDAFRITIAPAAAYDDGKSADLQLLSQVYEVNKTAEGRFDMPVTIRLRLAALPGAGKRAAVFYYDETARQWVKLGGTVEGDTITVSVDHFTKFAAFAYDDDAAAVVAPFRDIAGHWAAERIAEAVSRGIVSGYGDGTFKPDAHVTRAEFIAMLARALKLEDQAEMPAFADAKSIPAWSRSAIAQAAGRGILSGYEDGTVRPDRPITRAEMAAMIVRALQLAQTAGAGTAFADDGRIPQWAKPAVAAAVQAGLIVGRDGNRFAPSEFTTRAEAAVLLLKAADEAE